MTIEKAIDVIGSNRAKWELQAQVKALSLLSVLNTPAENEAVKAGKYCLKHWTNYCAICNRKRDLRSKRHG